MCLVTAEDGHRLLIVGLTAFDISHLPLSLATSHVSGLKIRVLLEYRREVVDRLTVLPRAHVEQGTIVESHKIGWIVLENKVKVSDGLVVVTDFGA